MDQCNGSIGELVITFNETKGCFKCFRNITVPDKFKAFANIETFQKLPFNLVHLTLKRVFLHLLSISPNQD